MGIREVITRKPKASVAVAGGMLVLGFSAAVFYLSTSGSGGAATPADLAFFTTDGGQTWFTDDRRKLAPFDHAGKQAVRAYVYECAGKRFVNHLERQSAEGLRKRAAFAEAMRTGKPPPPPSDLAAAAHDVEVMRPGGKEWVPVRDVAKAATILTAKCPDGRGTPVAVHQ